MKITTAIAFLAASIAGVAASSTITYNVISLISDNQTLGVIVDDEIYPLTSTDDASTLLHKGKAPVASTSYKYAILNKDNTTNIIDQESFSRDPITNSSKTLNEYYGRFWNSKSLDQVPTIMDPLPIINRIDSDLHIDGEIPTIHITGNQTAIDYIHANAESDIDITGLKLAYISPSDVKSFKNITLAVSGHSTRSYDKLSYKVKLQKDDDLYNYRRLKLRSMSTDASYMREEIAYDIAKSIGMPTSDYSYVRVYFNNQAIGLFGLGETLKNPWPKNEFNNGKKYNQGALFVADVSGNQGGGTSSSAISAPLGQNQTEIGASGQQQQNQTMGSSPPSGGMEGGGAGGGNSMVQGSSSDLSYLGDNTTLYTLHYPVKEDPRTGSANYTRIVELTKFISEQSNVTSDDSAASLWEQYMDVTSFLRGLALEIVISDSDGYFTMGNNYILYDDLDNERILFSGQDFDLTMGTSINNATLMNSGNYSDFPNFSTRPLTSRLFLVPEFKQEFENLIVNMTKALVNPDILTSRINQLYEMLQEDVAWDKSLPRVAASNSSSSPTSKGMGSSSVDDQTFYAGVYGPTNASTSLAEWLALRSSNILTFFNESI
ncbi:tRNA-specific adenosine deaminase subunit tad3 [Mucor velutinosus]|uniref:tRNA-specific adenosine deaminase subunit tad3 n=1 Tax=Mucor velutinosus TaxID=708070 RepID=A0AAN7I1K7_9FUNG|nr:tRNA-specific adenosine deaminase subunit tad3 [Mucor velutinosus]